MSAPPRASWRKEDYRRDAQEYLASLPLEHFMESVAQNTQARITEASFDLVRQRRPDFHGFGELLIHGRRGDDYLRVCPANMVVLGDINDEEDRLSYALEHEPAPVFWALEYVSESNKQKDYVDNFETYEQDVQVPYYLIFDPDEQDLHLYRLRGGKYAPVQPNEQGRLELPEVEMAVALLGGWVRYWYHGQLIPIPVELDRELQEQRRRVSQLEDDLRGRDEKLRQAGEAIHQRDEALRRADEERRRRDDAMAGMLRPLVEARARSAGRQDVLTGLPAADAEQLTRWLSELG